MADAGLAQQDSKLAHIADSWRLAAFELRVAGATDAAALAFPGIVVGVSLGS
jgi:hypothetical protein